MSSSIPSVNNSIANWLSAITHEAFSYTKKSSAPVPYEERFSYVIAFDQTRPYSFSLTVDKKKQLTSQRIVELLTNSDRKVGYQSLSAYYELSRPKSVRVLSCQETTDMLKLVIEALPFGRQNLPTIKFFENTLPVKKENLTKSHLLKFKIN